MNPRNVILAIGLSLALGGASRAVDTVKADSGTYTGRVTAMTRTEVTLDRSGVPRKIPANEIVMIYFDDEPTTLKTTARVHLSAGRYNDALEALQKLQPADLPRAEIQQDVAFYKALCSARLALGGTGTLESAKDLMSAFVHGNVNSYHFYEGCEVLGNLYVALQQYADAEKYYVQLEKSPWPEYQMRGSVVIGRARLAQGKTAEALQAFNQVLALQATTDQARSQHLAAKLGIARCSAATGEPDEALEMVQQIIANADPEDVELHARAYNTLGTTLRKAGKTKEALLAFLHVDVLYFAVPETHAEALANLDELWTELHKTEQAVRARRILQEQYQNSPWAKKGG